MVSFYGVGLGPAKALGAQVADGVVRSSLGGVQVLFNNVAAPLLYAGPNQINAIVPASVYGMGQDTVTVQIVTPTGTLTGPSLAIVPTEPEVFQNVATGAALALNQDGSLNSAANPAAPGSIVTVWATGAGDSVPGNPDGYIEQFSDALLLPVSVVTPNLSTDSPMDSVDVLYAATPPGLVMGAIQVNFRLPAWSPQSGTNQITCELQVGSAISSAFQIYVSL